MANYCRREVSGKPCGKSITKSNALNWCQDCRARLPLWPIEDGNVTEESREASSCVHDTPDGENCPQCGAIESERRGASTKEVLITSPEALELFGEAVRAEVR